MALLRRILRTIFRSAFLTVVTVVVAPVVMVVTVLAGLVLLPLPATIPVAKAATPLDIPSIIYDSAGNPIATLAETNQNIPVAPADIPAVMKEAIIADEDRNFYHEGGISLRGTFRAMWADLNDQAVVQGGSTITQQYVKLAYTGDQRTLLRKVKESILASELSRRASKAEILYRYLTIIYFGDGSYGVGSAAEDYFRVPVSQLTVSEAATLAGVVPAPSERAPREHLATAEADRQLVLGEMRKQGYLTQAQYQAVLAQHLWYAGNGPAPPDATIVYPPKVVAPKYPAFVDYVTRWLLQHYPPSEVYGGGLRVQTTLDPALQADAESAVSASLAGTTDPLEMALVSVEPQTGFVKAMVGGRGFGVVGAPYSDDNLALGGCDYADNSPASVRVRASAPVGATCWTTPTVTGGGSGRQPGSSWKPFVLAAAMEQGISPETVFPAPGVLAIPGCTPGPQQDCAIHNDEGGAGAPTTLRAAMASSINTVYAQLIERVGCPAVANVAKALGITSAYYSTTAQPFCAPYALGEIDVSPLDMASAYGVFANHGQRAAPTPVVRIVDLQGRVVLDNIAKPPPTTAVMPANVADNVTNVLQGVFGPGGTGYGDGLNRPAAGKTGTASNYTNAWFVGYTPTLSTSVWMGEANGEVPIAYCPYGQCRGNIFGATVSAPTWKAYMTAALANVPPTPFTQPAPIVPPNPAAIAGPFSTTTTIAPVQPASPSPTSGTPSGGPYTEPPPPAATPPAPSG